MYKRLIVALLVTVTLAGCATEDDAGYSLTLAATLSPDDDGMLPFFSPQGMIAARDPADVVGKPYLVAVFPAGFSVGNDPPLWQRWGTVPASLEITETTTPSFEPGPYDMVLIVYTNTPVSAAQLAFEETPPLAGGGDLASFNLSSADVLPGDPMQPLGFLRMNVVDSDVRVELENRTPSDLDDRDQTASSFERTILVLP